MNYEVLVVNYQINNNCLTGIKGSRSSKTETVCCDLAFLPFGQIPNLPLKVNVYFTHGVKKSLFFSFSDISLIFTEKFPCENPEFPLIFSLNSSGKKQDFSPNFVKKISFLSNIWSDSVKPSQRKSPILRIIRSQNRK